MKIEKYGSAQWSGGLKDGKGKVSTQSGALNAYPYGFNTRFEGVTGSNPEELIGAAHAACFTMALSMMLGEAGLTAESLETKANVTLEKLEAGFAITAIELVLKGKVPGADEARFTEIANQAKAGCPVSKALAAVPISLSVTLG
ncbi:OsmC family protein [Agrobacterium vitis]|uniref:Osmotically inducible protein OsmC n=2 Tax=Rhizobium/Agrobacterium group TaxID=227290 RepID=B9K135_ALLAM|nr:MULTISPECIES: OsmC family protein [Rhizobium/Agrobacterium group]ACM38583.1 osmotically inducible protein OsmC [Allorhizobium ampelinum S4]MCF1445751.1 OsmC family protein [Allorhizobium ampelinum]MCF1491257.1 OsmC family protein [Allorhizobium ampelinum]MUO26718.1 OsmC family peroxiredoxin [Agrobacterium vitis]MUO41831.1 OsmC family peroxiredoxin [Agrobacterium vitis]